MSTTSKRKPGPLQIQILVPEKLQADLDPFRF